MADKYLNPYYTVNGDGTTPDEATVEGGPGAWNSVDEVLFGTPTYGAINDGDVIHLVGGYTHTLTAAVSTTDFSTINVTFISDSDGSIWPGYTGPFQFDLVTYTLTLRGGRWIGLRVFSEDITQYTYPKIYLNGCIFEKGQVHYTYGKADYSFYLQNGTLVKDSELLLYSCPQGLLSNSGWNTIVNCKIRLDDGETGDGILSIVYQNYGSRVTLINCDIDGTEHCSELWLLNSSSSWCKNTVEFYNCKLGSAVTFGKRAPIYVHDKWYGENLNGCGFFECDNKGWCGWLPHLNVPFLYAENPLGQGWSIMGIARLEGYRVGKIGATNKLGNTRLRITVNFILEDSEYNYKDNAHFYVNLYYTSGGEQKYVTSKCPDGDTPTPLAAGDTHWQPQVNGQIVYGAKTYTPYQIVLETPDLVEDNTTMLVDFVVEEVPPVDDSYFFIDPHVIVEAIS